jgi:uncharacterized membrane protein required for colicin V production
MSTDVIALIIICTAALAGHRWGTIRLAGSVVALPITIAVSFALHSPLAAFIGALTPWSNRTANTTSFSLLLVASLACVIRMSNTSRPVMPGGLLSAPDRLAGTALGALSGLIVCMLLVVFISNLPGGRSAVDASLLWRSLHWMGVV